MKRLGREDVKTLSLSALGGTLEFYDFIIFVIFTPYFHHHFFPEGLDEKWKLFNTYGAYAAGYLARPLGGIIMAHFGDKFGRKNMFMLSIVLMVIPTFVLAVMPTYQHIGYFAIVILFIIRVLQGIAIGGELPGAWVFVREHSPKHSIGMFLGLLTCGVAGGILLGTSIALVLQLNFGEQVIKDWAWRIPFGIGGVFGIVSVRLRKYLSETPTFQELKKQNQINDFPLKEVLKNYKPGVVLSLLITWVLTACVMVMLLLMPNFAKVAMGIDAISNTCLQMGGVFMMLVGLVASGALADNFKPSSICKFFAIGLCVFCSLYFYETYVGKNVVLFSIYYLLACVFTGIVNFASIFMCAVYRPNVRFSGISFSYNVAYAIVGFITPILLLKLHSNAIDGVGGIYSIGPGIYLCFISVLAYVCAIIFDKIKLEEDN